VLKVIITEDDLMIADLLKDVIAEADYDVCGIARTVPEAVDLVERHRPDLAVVDMRLADGGMGTDLIARLDKEARPGVLYTTGIADENTLTAANGEGCLRKPFRPDDLLRALKIIEQIVTSGFATPPFPAGFKVLR
jgi:DNA-binding response OmpR family regulator